MGVGALVTAGPTREPLDPVRFLGNRSSGRMGYAVAQALVDRGAEVILVSGPCGLDVPTAVELVRVETALEMHAAVMPRAAQCDLFVLVSPQWRIIGRWRPNRSRSRRSLMS